MSTIHVIGGEKGGVGKSVCARLLSQYFLDGGQKYLGLDADQSHATLSRFYGEYTQPVQLDEFESSDAIIEAAVEEDINILLDLPAQSERFLDRWFEESGVLELCQEMGIPLAYWYMIDDGTDSAGLLEQFLEKYNGKLNCIVVKNLGRGSNFESIDQIISNLGADSRVIATQLPALHPATMNKIDKLSFSFWGAQNIRSSDTPHLSLMERQRTKVWMNKAYAGLQNALAQLQTASI
ncbi:MAG: mobilization protein [Pseudomonadales bacterium]|nr:mobilization protein [Pseudomonadales bacterium]